MPFGPAATGPTWNAGRCPDFHVTPARAASSSRETTPNEETDMKPRLDPYAAAPGAMKAMLALEAYVRGCGLESSLIELVKTRASQINGCAFCIDMHTRDARAHGETEQRLHLLAAWRESPLYSDRERAALAWTEALTLVAAAHAPDAEYKELGRHFSETEIVNLSLLIATINSWNRLAIAARLVHPIAGAVAGAAAAAERAA